MTRWGRLGVRLAEAEARGREVGFQGWVAGHAAGFLLPAPKGRRDVVVVHPGFVPERLARIVGLGPRPRSPPPRRCGLGPSCSTS
jgi:hypothetical protein